MRVYYYGCVEVFGHYMRSSVRPKTLEERRAENDFFYSNPWGSAIDGGLCPKGGGSALHQKDGWTALSFWDNTVDHRPGSNSNFLAEGTFTFEEMVKIAAEYFPDVMARIGKVPKNPAAVLANWHYFASNPSPEGEETEVLLPGAKILIEQLCRDLNQAHDEILKLQNCPTERFPNYDWPEWTPQANSIRAAEIMLGKKLAKTDTWTMFPLVEKKVL